MQQNNRIELGGDWTLTEIGSGMTIPARLPGDNYSALLAAGKIPDPYWGRNEELVQSYRDSDWLYRREFEVAPEFLAEYPYVSLNLERVDTFAEIRLNGRRVLTTENLFRRYRVEVRRLLKPGVNVLEIRIASAAREAAKLAADEPLKLPDMQGQVKTINRIRKVQCHAGWDWGICLMVSGVYGELALTGHHLARLEHLSDHQCFEEKRVRVELHAEVFAFAAGELPVEFEFDGRTHAARVRVEPGDNEIKTEFVVERPRLWYPRGFGEQELYPARISTPDESLERHFGLRKLEVVNEPDAIGHSLFFRVNGVDVFAKGADWIPCDAFPGRQTPERVEWLLDSAVAANMNMLRVWGGGQYEPDFFYEMCDRKGLLIWQDMMFACSIYPSHEAFLDNVRRELEFQIKRLRHHPAIALWCGDNECLQSFRWNPLAREHFATYVVNYDRLNRELAKMVESCDPERKFWTSSPCAGVDTFEDNQSCDTDGDMHYWAVWHGGRSFEAYYEVKPRFCSEFGYQSFPSFETVKTYADPANYNVFSPLVDYHEKCYHGCAPIIGMFGKYFRMPSRFEDFLYLSQVQQALAIKTGVEYWRSLRPRCMGTIIWQLNDNWPVASWSSLEYGGKWKLLHYAARNFYAPLAVVAYQVPGGVWQCFVLNDQLKALNLTLRSRVFDFSGKVLQEERRKVRAAAAAATEVKFPHLPEGAPETRFLHLALELDGRMVAENTVFLVPYKRCELAATPIRTQVAEQEGRIEVEVEAEAPAFMVALDSEGVPGVFSDNCFTLLPGEPRRLIFEPRGKATAAELERVLSVQHLRGTY